MFCSKCGSELPQETLFCSKCGNNINAGKNTEKVSILTGEIDRRVKISAFYAISILIMGGALIPILMPIFNIPNILKLHTSNEVTMALLPAVLYLLGYGVAVLLFSHFFSTTIISKVLVKIVFIVYLLEFVLVAFNIPFLLFALVSIDFNMISDIWPGQVGVGNYVITDGEKRKMVLSMIAIIGLIMASYALINALLLKRWFKKEQGVTLKEGLRDLFKPKFDIGKVLFLLKHIK